MPTILEILGWRIFFSANEGHEPIHVHAKKAEMEQWAEFQRSRSNEQGL